VIAHCSCGTAYWAEPSSSYCPHRGGLAVVRARLEGLEEFEARVLAYARTTAEIRSLPEAPA
jgi:hypothetical protein